MAAGVQAKESSASGPGCSDKSAKQCVDLALDAMGGRDRLQQVKSVRLHTIGHTLLAEQSYRQEPFITSYERGQTTLDLANQRMLKETKLTWPESDPDKSDIDSILVVGPDGGVQRAKDGDSCPYRKCCPARTSLKSAIFKKMKLRPSESGGQNVTMLHCL
jgi:hypothetical protein